MTIRRLPSTFIVRFFAVVIVTLTVLPFTQPFSPIAAWDLYEVGNHKSETSKPIKDVATVVGILERLAPSAGRTEAIAGDPRNAVDLRQSAPLFLRIYNASRPS